GAGDVNGDGYADYAIGDPAFQTTGAVWLASGQKYLEYWGNFGIGWPGSYGEPYFQLEGDPLICGRVTLEIGNSLGRAPTHGTLFAGFRQGKIPTAWDGLLQVGPPWFIYPLAIPAQGLSLRVELPCDTSLSGLELDMQVLEIDPGASKGISFTKGLKMVL